MPVGLCLIPAVPRRGILPSCSGSGGQESFILHSFFRQHLLKNVSHRGTFLEVGANNGVNSNTLHLEVCLGWRGVLVEGHPATFELLRHNRPRALVVSSAMCRTHGTVAYTSGALPTAGILASSSPRQRIIWRNRTTSVPCGPLSDWLRLLRMSHIDFFSLDVEGAQRLVLCSMDWTSISVSVLVVECKAVGCTNADDDEIAYLLEAQGFIRLASLRVRHDVWDAAYGNRTWMSIHGISTVPSHLKAAVVGWLWQVRPAKQLLHYQRRVRL
jgi:FkbM family methyltransferase